MSRVHRANRTAANEERKGNKRKMSGKSKKERWLKSTKELRLAVTAWVCSVVVRRCRRGRTCLVLTDALVILSLVFFVKNSWVFFIRFVELTKNNNNNNNWSMLTSRDTSGYHLVCHLFVCVCVCEWICVLSICLCLLFDKRQTLRALISTAMLDDHIRQLLSAYWPRPFGGLVSFFSWLDRHSSTTISLRPVLIQYRQR